MAHMPLGENEGQRTVQIESLKSETRPLLSIAGEGRCLDNAKSLILKVNILMSL